MNEFLGRKLGSKDDRERICIEWVFKGNRYIYNLEVEE